MKVSVLVVTYNHRRFIAQALSSVLTQEAGFDYEILVSEDRSTDGTREVVEDAARRHPERIRLILSKENLRSNRVVARGIRAARGQYLALLDGDDYWTDRLKLQRQVDFLDRHPECAICFHNALAVYEDGRRQPHPWTPPTQKEFSTLEDIWMGNFIATSSTMFRIGLVDVPDWYDGFFPITDWPLHILWAERGLIGYLDRTMSVYRVHPGGMYTPLSDAEKLDRTLRFYRRMDRCLGFRYRRTVERAIFAYFFGWAVEYEKRGEIALGRNCLAKCLTPYLLRRPRLLRRVVRMGLRLYRRRPAARPAA